MTSRDARQAGCRARAAVREYCLATTHRAKNTDALASTHARSARQPGQAGSAGAGRDPGRAAGLPGYGAIGEIRSADRDRFRWRPERSLLPSRALRHLARRDRMEGVGGGRLEPDRPAARRRIGARRPCAPASAQRASKSRRMARGTPPAGSCNAWPPICTEVGSAGTPLRWIKGYIRCAGGPYASSSDRRGLGNSLRSVCHSPKHFPVHSHDS
jgi:hypothetical protein